MAHSEEAIEVTEYRLVLVDPKARSILMVKDGLESQLPAVQIPLYARHAAALQKACLSRWGLEVFLVSFLPSVATDRLHVAVFQLLSPGKHVGLNAISTPRVDEFGLSSAQTSILHDILEGRPVAPTSYVGWIDDAIAWVETVTQTDLASRSDITQWNAGIGFALVRFRMSDGTYWWLKATGAPNEHEYAITSFLADELRASSLFLPRVRALHKGWNAWLMDGSGVRLRDTAILTPENEQILEDVVRAFACLRIATLDSVDELFQLGAFSQSFDRLIDASEELFDYLKFAMGRQTSTKAPQLEGSRLAELSVFFRESCARLQELDMPQGLVHGDLNRGNILESRGFKFIDWSEAYVASPFICLQHLLLLNRAEDEHKHAALDQRLKGAYVGVWSEAHDPAALIAAMPYMPMLAAVSSLYGRGDSLQSSGRAAPHRLAYARTLARHIDRAQRSLISGSPSWA